MVYNRHRLPREQWWIKLRALNRILAKHETVYVSETIKEERDVELAIDEQEAEEVIRQAAEDAAEEAASAIQATTITATDAKPQEANK